VDNEREAAFLEIKSQLAGRPIDFTPRREDAESGEKDFFHARFLFFLRTFTMEPSPESLPVFPLPMMVLPAEVSALHIFEPRYREMIAHCRAEPNPLGDFVIQYEEDERSAAYATTVRITKILNEQEDGMIDLLVTGRRRVEVVDRFQKHLYHSAKTLPWEDEEEDWDDELATRVYALHRQLLVTVTGDEPPDSFYAQEGGIAFKVAACAGVDNRTRLYLMKSKSETERLNLLRNYLEDLVPKTQDLLPRLQTIATHFALTQAV
jgi:Lon protease-like protein